MSFILNPHRFGSVPPVPAANILLIEGWDVSNTLSNAGNLNDTLGRGWTGSIAAGGGFQAGRYGGRALTCTATTDSTSSFRKAFTAGTTRVCGVSMRISKSPTFDRDFLALINGTTDQVKLTLQATTRKIIIKNGDGTVLHTTTDALVVDQWHSIEMKVVHHATAGEVHLKLDGTTIATVIGVNTVNGGAANIDGMRVWLRGNFTLAATGGHAFDDMYVADDFPAFANGPRVEALVPSGEIATELTPQSGTDNAAMLEIPYNGTTYNDTGLGTPGKDQLGITALGGGVTGTIAAIQLMAGFGLHASGSASITASTCLWSGGTEYNGPDTVNATSDQLPAWDDIRKTNPANGGGWDAAAVNALNIGYRATAVTAAFRARFSTLVLEVLAAG